MKIGIASHIVLDIIKSRDSSFESLGGPACYCGITAKQFGFDIELATKVGKDFPTDAQGILHKNGITLQEHNFTGGATTRFVLETDHDSRQLMLQAYCDRISEQDIAQMKVDCWLVSPVVDEIPSPVLQAIKKNGGKQNFVMLDPQGYVRNVSSSGHITIKNIVDIDLTDITALKVDAQELAALTNGLVGLEGMKVLREKGVEFVIATEYRTINMLHKDMHYWIKLRDIDTPDATGVGDILAAAFACAWIKEKDPLWALCFGAGAVQAALEKAEMGLAKVPSISKIESNASYFYNSIGFRDV